MYKQREKHGNYVTFCKETLLHAKKIQHMGHFPLENEREGAE